MKRHAKFKWKGERKMKRPSPASFDAMCWTWSEDWRPSIYVKVQEKICQKNIKAWLAFYFFKKLTQISMFITLVDTCMLTRTWKQNTFQDAQNIALSRKTYNRSSKNFDSRTNHSTSHRSSSYRHNIRISRNGKHGVRNEAWSEILDNKLGNKKELMALTTMP